MVFVQGPACAFFFFFLTLLFVANQKSVTRTTTRLIGEECRSRSNNRFHSRFWFGWYFGKIEFIGIEWSARVVLSESRNQSNDRSKHCNGTGGRRRALSERRDTSEALFELARASGGNANGRAGVAPLALGNLEARRALELGAQVGALGVTLDLLVASGRRRGRVRVDALAARREDVVVEQTIVSAASRLGALGAWLFALLKRLAARIVGAHGGVDAGG